MDGDVVGEKISFFSSANWKGEGSFIFVGKISTRHSPVANSAHYVPSSLAPAYSSGHPRLGKPDWGQEICSEHKWDTYDRRGPCAAVTGSVCCSDTSSGTRLERN